MSIITQPSESSGEISAAPALSCQVIESFEAAALLQEHWDQFIADTGGDLYMTWDWCHLWWQQYGAGRTLRIVLLREGDHLVGIAPMFVERVWLGPVWLKIARVIGSDSSLTLCNPPVRSGSAGAVFTRILRQFIEEEGCDAVGFGPLAGTYPILGSLREAAAGHPQSWNVARDRAIGVHITFDLPDSFDAYISGLGKSQRGNYRRQMRMLEADHKVDVQMISDPAQGLAEFDAFCQLHEAQWALQGKLGHFGDWPHAIEFNKALVKRMGELGYLRIIRTRADEKVISYHYGYAYQGCWYWRLPARVSGPEWDKLGLGNLSMVQKFAKLISQGVRRVESGIGHYDYKVQWGGQEHPLHSLLVVANRSGSRLRCRLFFKLADALHLLYYRIWFLRVAPKLPLKRRPLWRLWIRSRI